MSAGTLSFHGTTDKETALYRPGEKMIFSVQLLDDAKPLAVSASLDSPGFVHVEVDALGGDGKPLLDAPALSDHISLSFAPAAA